MDEMNLLFQAVQGGFAFTSDSANESDSHLISRDSISYQMDTHPRKKACINEVLTDPDVPRKKYVRGKQGGLQGILRIPLEILIEITYHITPNDLIALIRTNKFLRGMLLRRSATNTQIWQRARSNVPGLPSCPTGMSEPQYAALMFSKFCTLCGKPAPTSPDPFLRLRLCAKCRDTKLVEAPNWAYNVELDRYTYIPVSNVTKPRVKRRPGRDVSGNSFFCVREELEMAKLRRDKYVSKDAEGMPELLEWMCGSATMLKIQRREGYQLLAYMRMVDVARMGELAKLKTERRECIYERLRLLGWGPRELSFYGMHAKSWNALVEVPKLLTERMWNNLLPKLVVMLEENRTRILEERRQECRSQRRAKINKLLCQVKCSTHPYRAIIDTLGLATPAAGGLVFDQRKILPSPFPDNVVALEWDFLKDIYEQEITLERVEELFRLQRAQLDQKLLDWRDGIENQLVKQYGANEETDIVVKVRGKTTATEHLSRNTRFLLRADTVFKRKMIHPSDQYHTLGPLGISFHFPDMISSFDEYFPQYFDGPLRVTNPLPDQYVRNVQMEAIIRVLLKDLEMPDVAHIELQAMGSVFLCGRCNESPRMNWGHLVAHYRSNCPQSENDNIPKTWFQAPFPNAHSPFAPNPKPLVLIAPVPRDKSLSLPCMCWSRRYDVDI